MRWLVFLVACGEEEANKVPESVADTAALTEPPREACRDGGFERTATEWTLPGGWAAGSFNSIASAAPSCGDTIKPAFMVMDLTGDDLPELVITSGCSGDVGTTRWLVYQNRDTKFATGADDWALPGGYGSGAFAGASSATVDGCEGMEKPAYGLADVTGDGLVDLVITQACETVVGKTRWRVYPNTGSRFSDTAINYALPEGFGTGAFPSVTGGGSVECGADVLPGYLLADLTADGYTDMVITEACDDSVGRDHWLVYPGAFDRFNPAGVLYTLPPGYGTGAFVSGSAGASSCGGTVLPAYTLTDMDGDGGADLVITDDCGGVVGTSSWSVHRATADRFQSTPMTYGLPGGYATEAFDGASRASASGCGPSSPAFNLRDLDGDKRADLLVTADCSDTVGTSEWKVSPNLGSDFAAAATWELPPAPAAESYASESGLATACSGGEDVGYVLLDINGDGPADLVVTDTCEGREGTTMWSVYAGKCE